jgi:hypothetical protein
MQKIRNIKNIKGLYSKLRKFQQVFQKQEKLQLILLKTQRPADLYITFWDSLSGRCVYK